MRERRVQPVCRRTLRQDEDVELPRLEHVRASCGSCTFLSCGPWRLKRKENRGGATGARGPMASQRRGARGVRGKRVVDDARRARASTNLQNKGRASADRGNRATLPRTAPRFLFKSSARDSSRGVRKLRSHGSCDTAARGFPRAVDRLPSGMDSNLEAFSYNPAHGSVPASPYRAAGLPMVRIGGSSRTEPNYR